MSLCDLNVTGLLMLGDSDMIAPDLMISLIRGRGGVTKGGPSSPSRDPTPEVQSYSDTHRVNMS